MKTGIENALEDFKIDADPADMLRDYLIGLADSGKAALEQIQLRKVGTKAQRRAAREFVGESTHYNRYTGTVFDILGLKPKLRSVG